jgi:hypothetical protein
MTSYQLISKITKGWQKTQTPNSGGISNHDSIIYNFKSWNAFFKSGSYKMLYLAKLQLL